MPSLTFPISNLDPAVEARARPYADGDGMLDLSSAVAFYRADTGRRDLPSLSDLMAFLGQPQNKVVTEVLQDYQVLYTAGAAPNFKGDFRVPNFGADPNYKPAGNVRTGRQPLLIWENDQPRNLDVMNFLVDFNLIRPEDFSRLRSADVIVTPAGGPHEPGSTQAESVSIPMTPQLYPAQPGHNTYNRFSGVTWVPAQPERKLFAAQVETGDLRTLSDRFGGKGLQFYVQLTAEDGRRLYVNRDGQPFKNFHISPDEVAAQADA